MNAATDTCEPTDAPPHPFLAPRIVRDSEGKGRLAWRVVCDAVDPFHLSLFGPSKKSLVERLNVRAWVREATLRAERGRALCLAPPPPSACHEWHLQAIVAVGEGLFHHCTMPIATGRGGPSKLAHLRTGFTPERVTEAGRDGGWSRDWSVWVNALAQAKADLLTGALTAEETAHLCPNPDHVGYLRLDGVGQSITLGALEPLTGDKLRRFYFEPGDWSRECTCWA